LSFEPDHAQTEILYDRDTVHLAAARQHVQGFRPRLGGLNSIERELPLAPIGLPCGPGTQPMK
jgi:hypothetical protein